MKIAKYLLVGSLFGALAATPVLAYETGTSSTTDSKTQKVNCLQDVNKAFRAAVNKAWQTRKDDVKNGFNAYKTARQIAWDKYAAARDAANETYKTALAKAREEKSSDGVKAATLVRKEVLSRAKDTLQTERKIALETWTTARKTVVESWHATWRVEWDKFKAAQKVCRAS